MQYNIKKTLVMHKPTKNQKLETALLQGLLTAEQMPVSQAAQSRQPCVNSHQLSQWERVIFDPPQNRRPLTDR